MIKRVKALLAITLIAIFLCGCAGYRETTGGLVVSLIGIDRSGEEIRMTLQTVLPDTEGKVTCETVTANAKNIETAYNKLKNKMIKPPILEHCVGACLGSTLKKTDVLEFLNFAEEKVDINLSLNFFYTDDAYNFLLESGNYRQGGYDIIELIKNNDKNYQNKLFMIKRELHKQNGAKLPFLIFKGEEAVIEKNVILEGLNFGEK